jgi:hypothetical protein
MSLPQKINFSYLQCTRDAVNQTLQDLMSPGVDQSVKPNDRNFPICLNLIFLRKFGIPACGHPMHVKCWRGYKTQTVARSGVIKCPV